ncbi:GNAT family N-acetyltransferase [Clostridium sp. D33t1_170424_F3]|uniref:GNAT family N-acetyltransferase n=1 Tax=Clostridium sp. D33t1_170424_F3 TaxID=2787099 RepID=UPI0018AC5FEE|nr:GNAT family N-acetyltransferase [Clostridium sp. D33t1_170424_F3]
MEFTYQRGTLADVELLTKVRIQVLRAANQLSETEDLSLVEQTSRDYYLSSLSDGSHLAYLVFHGETVAGAGGVSFYRVMPTYHNPTGLKAYIMNMYTHPSFRRKGIAWNTLHLLVEEAKTRNAGLISLEATAMGKPLYEKYGFIQMQDELWLPQLIN